MSTSTQTERTTTSDARSPWDQSAVQPSPHLRRLVHAVRDVTATGATWSDIAERVAEVLRRQLPSPSDLLTPEQRLGEPDPLHSHLLHAEPDGNLSVVALITRPGQHTPIHDHVTWCASAVLQGVEREELFRLDDDGQVLTCCGTVDNARGEASGFAPPGDIHRVSNPSAEVAISILVYGTDISRIGSSVRREYDLPVRLS